MMNITYTPQEMIIKSAVLPLGASVCMSRDYILIWRRDYTFGRHVDDMASFLGVK